MAPSPPSSPAQVCATAFWNNDHRRAVFAHIRRVLEGVKPPLRRKKSLDIYISVYIRICENFIECGRVQVRFDGGEILKLIPRSYVFHFYKLWGESLFSLVFCCRKRFFFLWKILDDVWFKDHDWWEWFIMSLIDQRVVNCKRNESFLCNKYLKVYESMKFVNRMKEEYLCTKH